MGNIQKTTLLFRLMRFFAVFVLVLMAGQAAQAGAVCQTLHKALEGAISLAIKCAAKKIPVPDIAGLKTKLAKKMIDTINSKIPKCKRRLGLLGALKGAACKAVTSLCPMGCKAAVGAGSAAATAALAGFPVDCFTSPVTKACTSACQKVCK